MAPAHSPESRQTDYMVGDSVTKAREMVEAGHGDDTASFLDLNSGGRTRVQRISAAIYLSYYAPEGAAAMSLSAQNVKVRRILWLAPAEDPATAQFAKLVVPHLPPAAQLDRIDIAGGHLGAPAASAKAIVAWLNALPDE